MNWQTYFLKIILWEAWATICKMYAYDTKYSQAVTHPSTNLAQCCLTSVIRRELVLSTWYGRRHELANLFSEQKNCVRLRLRFAKLYAYDTKYSQAVTHPSTNLAQCCLTAVIRRELVLSTWYGRRHELANLFSEHSCLPYCPKIVFPHCNAKVRHKLEQHLTLWRNGSASDSRSEGCVFKSRQGQLAFTFSMIKK